MGKKLETTRLLQRIVALSYNHYFEAEVKKIKDKYPIPQDSREAENWLKKYRYEEHKAGVRHMLENKYTPEEREKLREEIADLFKGGQEFTYADFCNPGSNYLPKRLAENISFEISADNKKEEYRAPFTKEVEELLRRFKLPLITHFVGCVENYVCTGGKRFLDPDIWVRPNVHIDIAPHRGILFFHLKITGYIPGFTKKQLDEVWANHIKPCLNKVSLNYGRSIESLAKKRSTVESIKKQISRWAEWYQLSEVEGLGPVEALKQWESNHSDETGKYDQSTVTHAIQEFQDIITPRKI